MLPVWLFACYIDVGIVGFYVLIDLIVSLLFTLFQLSPFHWTSCNVKYNIHITEYNTVRDGSIG